MDFACKKFNIEEVVKCSLGLGKSDFRVLVFLIKNSREFTTDELSKRLHLDKSTIQRIIKRLHEKKLVSRNQKNNHSGGYIFLYKIKEKQIIKKNILNIVNSWFDVFHVEIENW